MGNILIVVNMHSVNTDVTTFVFVMVAKQRNLLQSISGYLIMVLQPIASSSPFAPIHEGNQCWLPFFMETEKYSLQEADLVYHIRIAERRSYIRTQRREYD